MTNTRWSKVKRPVHAIKRGLASLFVCAVVLLPLILGAIQIKGMISERDPRVASALPAMQVRQIDKAYAPYKPFDEPLITVTFDDGWETIYSQALPLLQKYGIPSTQYMLSGTSKNYAYMNYDQMKAMKQAGHELGCHSIDHQDLTTVNPDYLKQELADCKRDIEKETGALVREFASPYGRSSEATIAAIKEIYRSHRNTDGDITTNEADDQDINTRANFNRYNIICVTLRRDTTVAQLQAAIDYTVKHNGWLVLNYHQVDDGESDFGLDDKLLSAQLEAINKAPARVTTIGQVLDAIQKAKQ